MNYDEIIIDYERRLDSLKKELDELIISEHEGSISEDIIRSKITFFEKEIEHLSVQLAHLKSKYTVNANAGNEQSTTQQIPQPVCQSVQQQIPQPVCQPVQQPVYNIKEHDFEKTIGKSWMAVFASFLIFTSIVMFATLIIPQLSDIVKMGIMYMVSFAIVGFAVFKLVRNRDNKVWISLSACGMGAIFISLMLTRIYFEAIDNITLYVLILIWSVGICLLSRFQSNVYQIIGQIGLFIAIVLGTEYSLDNNDIIQFAMIIIFVIITQVVFFVTNYSESFLKNMVSHISVIIIGLWMMASCIELETIGGIYGIMGFLALYMIANVIMFGNFSESSGGLGGIYIPIAVMIAAANVYVISRQEEPAYFMVCYIFYLLMLVIIQIKEQSAINKCFIQITSVILLAVLALGDVNDQIVLFIIALACMAAALGLKDTVYQYCGAVFGIMYIWYAMLDSNTDIAILYCAIIIIAGAGTLFRNYRAGVKGIILVSIYIFLYILTEFFATGIAGESYVTDEYFTLWFSVVGIIHIVTMKTRISRNIFTNEIEKGFSLFLSIMNSLFVVMVIPMLLLKSDLVLLAVLVSIGLYFMNAQRLLNHRNMFVNMYVGFKFTVLLLVILSVLEVVSIVMSISCLVFAIVNIVIGFRLDKKALRVYGLVLANLSLIKLVLYDISYDNSVQRALSFFICGVLCFTISFIYNKIEGLNGTKKHNNNFKEN